MYTNETPKSQVSRQIQTDKEKKEFKKKKEKKKEEEEEESRRTQGVPLRSRSIIFANFMEINRLVKQIKKEQSIALPDH